MSTHQDKITEKPSQLTTAAPKANEVDDPVAFSLRKLYNEGVIPKTPHTFTNPGALTDEYVKSQYPHNAIALTKYSPFKPGEEDLQYLTFKSRSGEGEANLLRTHSRVDDESGRMAGPRDSNSRTSGDGTPRQGQAPRRKITLAEYTNKDRKKPTTPALKSTVPETVDNAKIADKETNPTTKSSEVTKPQQTANLGQKR